MTRNLATLALLLVPAFLPTLSAAALNQLALDQIEHRKGVIDLHPARLTTKGLESSIGAIGYRSLARGTADHPEWIEVASEKPVPLDEIVLVPTIRRDTVNGFQSDAFPLALRVLVGIGADRKSALIAEFIGESNVALYQPVSAGFRAEGSMRQLSKHTDGRSFYGPIQSVRESLNQLATRLLADLDRQIGIEDSDLWKSLAPQRRTDFVLFYQERLTNVIRHSGAARVKTQLRHNPGSIHLNVSDNGQGLHGPVPTSLSRRSHFLGAHHSAQESGTGGLKIDQRLTPRSVPRFG